MPLGPIPGRLRRRLAVVSLMRADYFGFEILSEILILAILVLALDMVAGFGGMVSLCHGALMGLSVWRTKADVFAISGALAGIAGVLAAQHIMYIYPGLLSWTVSGEALVVVILGGLDTLIGPLIGAAAFVVLKHEVSAITTYWHMLVGIVLVAVVVSRANGVYSWLEDRLSHRFSNATPSKSSHIQTQEAKSDA